MKKLLAICLISIFAFAFPMSAMATDMADAQIEKGMEDGKTEAKGDDAETKDASVQDSDKDESEKPSVEKADGDKEESK